MRARAVTTRCVGAIWARSSGGCGRARGRAFPYLWVPSSIRAGTACICISLWPYVKHSLIKAAWGRGIVHIKLLGDLPVGSGSLEEAPSLPVTWASTREKRSTVIVRPGCTGTRSRRGSSPSRSTARAGRSRTDREGDGVHGTPTRTRVALIESRRLAGATRLLGGLEWITHSRDRRPGWSSLLRHAGAAGQGHGHVALAQVAGCWGRCPANGRERTQQHGAGVRRARRE